jgi:hypothetical protein
VITEADADIFEQKKNPLALLDIKPQFVICSGHRPITISKELSCLCFDPTASKHKKHNLISETKHMHLKIIY